jgi:DNA excision repair protein ERCC-2
MKVLFPYKELRAEQKKVVNDVGLAVSEKKVLLVHAPTGLGKTVSSLAPALCYALKNKKRVFFLTPKVSQHEIVLETARLMNEQFGLGIKAVDLVGKRNMCLDPLISNAKYGFYEACSKKKKDGYCAFYNNTKGNTLKKKVSANRRKAEILCKYNRSHAEMKGLCLTKELCPYEITVEMVKNANLIIGDYSHLFNEEIRNGLLGQSKIELKDCIIIVDEAHNLPHRLRDMMACSLDTNSLERAAKEARTVGDFETEFLAKDLGKEMLVLAKKLSIEKNDAVLDAKSLDPLRTLTRKNPEKLEEAGLKFIAKTKTTGSYLLAAGEFLSNLLTEKKHTLHVIERKHGLGVSIYPLDAEEIASSVLNGAHSAILMSGTLLPLKMYADVLGIKEAVMKEYTSPFPLHNRVNVFVSRTTTKYTSRTDEQFDEMASIIEKVVGKVPGNTIVFFPSFEILGRVSPLLAIKRKVLKQEREMSHEEKSAMIKEFKRLGSAFGGVLLAVSGGSIAEGVDFPGENLLCAIIVGVPFAKVSIYSDALIKFYDEKFGQGWDYAYNAPAIGKAIQAAGRVIRTETDRGVCIFLDSRFSDVRYKKFFPKDFNAIKSMEPEKEVEEFFAKK